MDYVLDCMCYTKGKDNVMELKTVEDMEVAFFSVARNQWPGVNYEDVRLDSFPMNPLFIDIGVSGVYIMLNASTGDRLDLLANWHTGEVITYESHDELIATLRQQVNAAGNIMTA